MSTIGACVGSTAAAIHAVAARLKYLEQRRHFVNVVLVVRVPLVLPETMEGFVVVSCEVRYS